MTSRGKSKKNRRGNEFSGHSPAVVCANENGAESTAMIESDPLKEEHKLLKIENAKLRTENELLKEELQKLKEVSYRLERKTLESYPMEENTNSFEDVHEAPLNVASQQPRENEDTSYSKCVSSNQKELQTEDTSWSIRDCDEGSANCQTQGAWVSEEPEQENSASCVKNTYENDFSHGGRRTFRDGQETDRHKDKWNFNSRSEFSQSGRRHESRNTSADDYTTYKKQGQGRSNNRQDYQNANRRQGQGNWFGYKNDPNTNKGQWHGSDKRNFDHSDQGFRRENDRQFFGADYRRRDNPYDRSREHSEKDKINEIDGDLFTAPADHSLAHCVAADLRMGSGIAVKFKQQFKSVDELLGQRKRVGQVAILEDNGRYIYYLITKKYSTGKPTMYDLENSLIHMKEHVVKNQVKNIAIPRLGCGLDRLYWREVRKLLNSIFADVDVSITVYNFTEDFAPVSQESTPKKSIYITDKLMKLVNIEPQTLLVLFGSECGHVDNAMEDLDEKYRFIHDYKAYTRKMGDVIELTKRNEMLCILIVKKHESDHISYTALQESLLKLRKIFKREKYYYMGFTAFTDKDDDLTVAKIVTLLKVVFANIESCAWICWPDELKNIFDEHDFSHKPDA